MTEKPAKVMPDSPDVVEFVNKLFQDSVVNGVSVRDCFISAVTAEEFLRLYHDRLAVQASLHLPAVIDTMGKLAAQGDTDAAKILLDIAGISGKGAKSVQNNAIQVNITPQEQAVLERDFRDVIDITDQD
jgi:hypothetical protein